MYLVEAMVKQVGLPGSVRTTRRFLLKKPPLEFPGLRVLRTFETEKVYLKVNPWSRLRTEMYAPKSTHKPPPGFSSGFPYCFVRKRVHGDVGLSLCCQYPN